MPQAYSERQPHMHVSAFWGSGYEGKRVHATGMAISQMGQDYDCAFMSAYATRFRVRGRLSHSGESARCAKA